MEAPEFYQGNYCSQFAAEKLDAKTTGGDHFIVEDLLDFSHDEDAVITDASATFDNVAGNSTESSTVTAVDSCNSSSLSGGETNIAGDVACRNFADGHFSNDLCVPVILFSSLNFEIIKSILFCYIFLNFIFKK